MCARSSVDAQYAYPIILSNYCVENYFPQLNTILGQHRNAKENICEPKSKLKRSVQH